MDRSNRHPPYSNQNGAPTNAPKTPDERQRLLHFQRYSYSVNSINYEADEIDPPPLNTSRLQRVKDYLNAEITTRWADLILLACFFISGLVDAGAYNAYECFVSMQTGNTIFAALGVSDLPVASPKWAWTKSVVSIVSFLFGASLISLFHRHFGGLKRWVLATSFIFQTTATIIAAILVGSGTSSDSPTKRPSAAVLDIPSDPGLPWTDLFPIGLLAFQAAGKVVASRVLGFNAMPSVVLTTLYNDLVSDPGLFTAGLMGNVQRNRRVGGLVLYFGGAVIGGALAKSTVGFAGALWIAAFVKIGLVTAWLLWHEDKKDVEDEESS